LILLVGEGGRWERVEQVEVSFRICLEFNTVICVHELVQDVYLLVF
jgi:hypothetical protein